MNEKMVKKAKKVIKNFAEKYGLKYNPKWFRCISLPYEEFLIKKFLSGGPIGDYRFDNPEKRFKKIEKFIKSRFYKKIKKERPAQGFLIVFDSFNKEREVYKIKNPQLRKKVEFIYEKINRKFKSEYLVILPEINSPYILQILTHEWMHVLLNKNKVKKKKRGYDWFNEGLATLAEYLVNDETDKITKDIKEKKLSKVRYTYLKYALRWKEKLEKSKKRKGIIEKIFQTRKL